VAVRARRRAVWHVRMSYGRNTTLPRPLATYTKGKITLGALRHTVMTVLHGRAACRPNTRSFTDTLQFYQPQSSRKGPLVLRLRGPCSTRQRATAAGPAPPHRALVAAYKVEGLCRAGGAVRIAAGRRGGVLEASAARVRRAASHTACSGPLAAIICTQGHQPVSWIVLGGRVQGGAGLASREQRWPPSASRTPPPLRLQTRPEQPPVGPTLPTRHSTRSRGRAGGADRLCAGEERPRPIARELSVQQ
jgi:hypothetical protein